MTRILFLALFLTSSFAFAQLTDYPLLYHDTFDNGTVNWQPLFPNNWQVTNVDGDNIFEINTVGTAAAIRKPLSTAVLTPYVVGNFELEVVAKCYTELSRNGRDICLFFGYQDDAHFYYAHFSNVSDNAHNAIHIVNNADRQKINLQPEGTSIALMKDFDWYTLKIIRNVDNHTIQAFIDGKKVLTAIDSTFNFGRIGIGSFDDKCAFTEVKLWGERIDSKVGANTSQPNGYELAQNFPNPFNPKTDIRYTLANTENVELSVYDVCGRYITSLVNQQQIAGWHQVSFNGESLPSGMYVYRLSTPTFAAAKTMTLVE